MPIKKIQCSNQAIFCVYALVCHLFPTLVACNLAHTCSIILFGKISDEYLEQETIENFPSEFLEF